MKKPLSKETLERLRKHNLSYRKRYPDKIINYKRNYYRTNAERIKAYFRHYAQAQKLISKEFRLGTTACLKCDSLLVDIDLTEEGVIKYHCTKCGHIFQKKDSVI